MQIVDNTQNTLITNIKLFLEDLKNETQIGRTFDKVELSSNTNGLITIKFQMDGGNNIYSKKIYVFENLFKELKFISSIDSSRNFSYDLTSEQPHPKG